jgi:hypothetical protein
VEHLALGALDLGHGLLAHRVEGLEVEGLELLQQLALLVRARRHHRNVDRVAVLGLGRQRRVKDDVSNLPPNTTG